MRGDSGPVMLKDLVAKEMRRLEKLRQWRQEAERRGECPDKMMNINFDNPREAGQALFFSPHCQNKGLFA